MATIEKSPAREVLNQPPPLEGYNVFESNLPLVEALRREGAEAFEDRVRTLGERAGTAESLERGRLANENPPVLRTHDRYGNRIDEVEFPPAWHELLHLAVESGVHALPWREPVAGAQAGRAAMMLAMSGVESGTGCPLSMTYAGVPALRAQPEVAAEWEPRLLSLEYDRRCVPATEKSGALMGMAMTERQGGSDVRANTTLARPLNGGVPGIIEMVNYTRLDCVLGSTGLLRAAVAQAIHHCAHREAFGKPLIDQPLMRNVLADLAIESEAATLTAMRLARACDEGDPFKRLGLAVSKYWICKSAVWHVAEALECLGGNGYVELSGMPRLFREAPLNSIWEGSGNVNCLDVLRGMVRSPDSVEAFFAEVESAGGEVADHSRGIRDELSDLEDIELRARRIVERMAVALQASVLVRHGDPAVADAFVATRLLGDHGRALGTLPRGTDFERIVERHRPL